MAMGSNFFLVLYQVHFVVVLDAVLCPLLVRYYPSQGCS